MGEYSVVDLIQKNRLSWMNGDGLALVDEDRAYTYGELDERAGRLASALVARGFRKGDRAGVLLYNRAEWFELFFALAKLGGVMVPINYLLTAPEVKYILEDCGARWLFSERGLDPLVEPIRGELTEELTYLGVDGCGDVDYATVLEGGALEPVEWSVGLDDLLLLQYTSGTTGFPKGAMHTHGTVLWSMVQQIPQFGLTHRDTHFVFPAMCWAAGFHVATLGVLWAGGKVVLRPSAEFRAEPFLEALATHRITVVFLVPSVIRLLLDCDEFERYDLSALRLVVTGGEPAPVSVITDFQRRLPTCDLIQGYGLTEFPASTLLLDKSTAVSKAGAAGKASLVAEVRVVREDGTDTDPGEPGEIISRSPATMLGYYGNPEETAKALRDGWLHTGDRGYVDEDGFVYISGRVKDMIISGGLNIYPAEIERVLVEHPGVLEAAVIGVPHERYQEVGRAVVVLKDGATVSESELDELCRAKLASFKVPREWDVRTAPLPRTASGKVQKFRLTEELAQA